MRASSWGGLAAGLAICACATPNGARPGQPEPPSALASITGKSGTELTGTVTFRKVSEGVLLNLRLVGAPPGLHGVHLHAVGDCSAPDASSAGPHWNPTGAPHGNLMAPPAHLGDLGNLVVREDGSADLEFLAEHWTIGTGQINDVVGTAVIIHANPDDLTSQPSGAAGPRIGCGVVRASSPAAVSARPR